MQRQLKTGISDVFPELTEDVIGRMRNAASPRLRAVMEILIRHLHAFVRESRLTQEEWGVRDRLSHPDRSDMLAATAGVHPSFGHPRRLDAGRRREPQVGCGD